MRGNPTILFHLCGCHVVKSLDDKHFNLIIKLSLGSIEINCLISETML